MAEDIKTAEVAVSEDTAEAEAVDTDLGTQDTDAEFTDGAEQEGGRPENNRVKTDKATNSENAHRRREQERARELEAARINAIIEAVGENPFTGEVMKDADDVAEYLAMKEIQKQGGDPLNDYAAYQKKKARENRAAEEEAQKKDAWFTSDWADFTKKHPDVELDKLIADEGFTEYAEGKIGVKPLAEIYEGYERLVKRSQKSAEDKAAQALANSKASPGALSGGQTSKKEYFTPEEVRAMSREEVKENYENIKKSMKKWT